MANAFVKSVVWLVTYTSVGYGLFLICSSRESENQKAILTGEKQQSERLKHRQNIVNVLKSASESDQPIYRLAKKELDSAIRK